MNNLIPLFIMCDRNDISVIPMVRAPFTNQPTIYVYDKYPGGVGLSKKIYQIDDMILKTVFDHIKNCQLF